MVLSMNLIARRKKMKRTSKQVGGSHYETLKYEPVEAFIHYNLDWFQSEIIKYCSRFLRKNGKQDLDKAFQVADIAIGFGLDIDTSKEFKGDNFLEEYISQFEYYEVMSKLMIAVINKDYVLVKTNINKLIEIYYG